MGKISKVLYKELDFDVNELSKSYFYKSSLKFTDIYYEDFCNLEEKMVKLRNQAVSESPSVSIEAFKNTIIGLSSIRDKVIAIV